MYLLQRHDAVTLKQQNTYRIVYFSPLTASQSRRYIPHQCRRTNAGPGVAYRTLCLRCDIWYTENKPICYTNC